MQAEYLVTGGAGFIGSNLVHTLVGMGRAVRVLDNFSTGRELNLADLQGQIEIQRGDLRDAAAVRQAVRHVRYVIHIGALPSVARSVEDPVSTNDVNITGTLHVLREARDAGVERVVFSSSSSVYGDTPVLPKQEAMPPMPLSPYALSKLAGEHYARLFHSLYGLKTFSLRYFNVFGPRQDPQSHYAAVIPKFIGALRNNRSPSINGDGLQTRDFTFVEDVVAANLACCSAPEPSAGSAYNVGCNQRTSVKDLALTLAKILGKDIQPTCGPAQKGDVRDSQADITRARDGLGWIPKTDFETGLRKTVDWFLRNEPA